MHARCSEPSSVATLTVFYPTCAGWLPHDGSDGPRADEKGCATTQPRAAAHLLVGSVPGWVLFRITLRRIASQPPLSFPLLLFTAPQCNTTSHRTTVVSYCTVPHFHLWSAVSLLAVAFLMPVYSCPSAGSIIETHARIAWRSFCLLGSYPFAHRPDVVAISAGFHPCQQLLCLPVRNAMVYGPMS